MKPNFCQILTLRNLELIENLTSERRSFSGWLISEERYFTNRPLSPERDFKQKLLSLGRNSMRILDLNMHISMEQACL